MPNNLPTLLAGSVWKLLCPRPTQAWMPQRNRKVGCGISSYGRWLLGTAVRQALLGLCMACMGLTLAHAQAATYTIDPLRSSTTYELGSLSSGRFERHTGTIALDLEAKTGWADVSIDAASVRSGMAFIDSILVGTELFNASQYPSIRFVGDQFVFSGDTLTEVAGNLTLLGKTLPVVLHVSRFACRSPAAPEPEVCSGSFETSIDRTDYGMDLGVSLGMPKNVHLVVQVEAIRQ